MIENLTIESIAFKGLGVARRKNGQVCFIPYTIQGEEVEVEIINEKKSYSLGRIVHIIKTSTARQEQECNYYQECGGCQYRHMSYEEEIKVKKQQFLESFFRFANVELKDIDEVIPSPSRDYYRNKLNLHNDKDTGEYGFWAESKKKIVAINNCLLAKKEINTLINPKLYKIAHKKKARELIFRSPVKSEARNFFSRVPSNVPWAKEESFSGKELHVPYRSFFQVNTELAKILQEKIKCWVENLEEEYLVDCYCGCGFLSLEIDKQILGFDCDKQNIKAAKINAQNFGLRRHKYIRATDKKFFKTYTRDKASIFLLDPPRQGCDVDFLRNLLNYKPNYILYISCHVVTQARDIKALTEFYQIEKTALLDMFPNNSYFESIILLKKKDL